jgi:GWxTD domain-containing protein
MPASTRQVPQIPDAVTLYRRMGLLAEGGETPFVGTLSFFAGSRFDSTTIVLTVALANRTLQFEREGDRYRAMYQVGFEIRQGTRVVRDLRSRETIRVIAFRETTRADESVLFRQIVRLAPGTYDVRLTVRDEKVTRGSAVEATVGVPRFGQGSVSSPVAFYEANPRERLDSLPRVVATPRATAIFGRDSVIPFYLEGYGPDGAFPVSVVVRTDGSNVPVWTDSVVLPRRAELFSGTFDVPIARLGVGVMSLAVSRMGSPDTVRVPIFVAFGEELPVATFPDMLHYLRYYASPGRLQALRDARAESRAALWAAFLRDTDPVDQTPEHEGLRDYFGRIAQANTRFREEGTAGWLTDRGRVAVALGTPDQIYQPMVGDVGQRGRTQIWEYRQHRIQLVFVDQTGFGRWRLTLSSEGEFEGALRRVLVQ